MMRLGWGPTGASSSSSPPHSDEEVDEGADKSYAAEERTRDVVVPGRKGDHGLTFHQELKLRTVL